MRGPTVSDCRAVIYGGTWRWDVLTIFMICHYIPSVYCIVSFDIPLLQDW